VLIGPVVKIDPVDLPRFANIHWLGGKSYPELPAYLSGWDVGIMPFAINEATRYISPTKTPEFFAAGLPVVSTPIADVIRPYGHAGLVEIAATAEAFVAHAEALLERPREAWLRKVDRHLSQTSWDLTWTGMMARWRRRGPAGAVRAPRSRRMRRAMFDWLVVGAGFAGSVLAERLASQRGERVLVVDRRPHIGGNAYDVCNDAGLLIHQYGPHSFHTNARQVLDYLSQFTSWRPYEHRVLSEVDGMLVPIPINLDTINRLYGLDLTSEELEHWFADRAEAVEEIRTSEDVVVSPVGRELYEKFFRGYTRKQWASIHPSSTSRSRRGYRRAPAATAATSRTSSR
jgi:UDP-galactopyranose mutase